jgi:hypothetical protein
VATAIHGKLFMRLYQIVRPLVLWRLVRRHALPTLEPAGLDHIVISGTAGITIGWKLARRYPRLAVSTELPPSFPVPAEDPTGEAGAEPAAAEAPIVVEPVGSA